MESCRTTRVSMSGKNVGHGHAAVNVERKRSNVENRRKDRDEYMTIFCLFTEMLKDEGPQFRVGSTKSIS